MSAQQIIDDIESQGFALSLSENGKILVRSQKEIPETVIAQVKQNKGPLLEWLESRQEAGKTGTAELARDFEDRPDYHQLPDDLTPNESAPRWQLLRHDRVIFETDDYEVLTAKRDEYASTREEAQAKKIRVRQNPRRLPLSYGANPANRSNET